MYYSPFSINLDYKHWIVILLNKTVITRTMSCVVFCTFVILQFWSTIGIHSKIICKKAVPRPAVLNSALNTGLKSIRKVGFRGHERFEYVTSLQTLGSQKALERQWVKWQAGLQRSTPGRSCWKWAAWLYDPGALDISGHSSPPLEA